jgi:hypothetical protein
MEIMVLASRTVASAPLLLGLQVTMSRPVALLTALVILAGGLALIILSSRNFGWGVSALVTAVLVLGLNLSRKRMERRNRRDREGN